MFSLEDAKTIVLLLAVAPAALLPERFWQPFCRLVARAYVLIVRPQMESIRACLPESFLTRVGGERGLHAQVNTISFEGWVQALRSHLPGGWSPRLRLVSSAHIDEALERGTGAVLWVSQFSTPSLVTKMALHAAGYELHHLSRPGHPFSGSRFGKRFRNPIQTSIENHYLTSRHVMGAYSEVGELGIAALRALRRRLSENGLVTITVAESANRLVGVPFFEGSIWLPTGPANLALAAGAPLLPVFAIRTGVGSYEVRVEAPLAASPGANRTEAIRGLVSQYASLLERYVEAYPRQWQGPLTLGRTGDRVEAQPTLVEG